MKSLFKQSKLKYRFKLKVYRPYSGFTYDYSPPSKPDELPNIEPQKEVKKVEVSEMNLKGTPKPEPPYESCCGNGCQNCVFIPYWELSEEWERQNPEEK